MRSYSFSFSGAGWLKAYHYGVAKALQENGIDKHIKKYAGASAGALVSAALITEADFDVLLQDTITKTAEIRDNLRLMLTFGQVLEEMIDKHIGPEKFYKYQADINKRLEIAVSALPRTPLRLQQFSTYEEFKTALTASCNIPPFTGMPVRLGGGHWAVDGGLTDNQPMIDQDTVTVSPWFASQADIRGKVELKWYTTLVPPSTDDLQRLFKCGYDEANEWIHGGGSKKTKFQSADFVNLHQEGPGSEATQWNNLLNIESMLGYVNYGHGFYETWVNVQGGLRFFGMVNFWQTARMYVSDVVVRLRV